MHSRKCLGSTSEMTPWIHQGKGVSEDVGGFRFARFGQGHHSRIPVLKITSLSGATPQGTLCNWRVRDHQRLLLPGQACGSVSLPRCRAADAGENQKHPLGMWQRRNCRNVPALQGISKALCKCLLFHLLLTIL